jgi:hypothetical protein
MLDVRRREFMALLGGVAAAWPVAARAQDPAVPLIGFLNSSSLGPFARLVDAFPQGLREGGYVEGRNTLLMVSSASAVKAALTRRRVRTAGAASGLGHVYRQFVIVWLLLLTRLLVAFCSINHYGSWSPRETIASNRTSTDRGVRLKYAADPFREEGS